jgi:hypothetical protein
VAETATNIVAGTTCTALSVSRPPPCSAVEVQLPSCSFVLASSAGFHCGLGLQDCVGAVQGRQVLRSDRGVQAGQGDSYEVGMLLVVTRRTRAPGQRVCMRLPRVL